MTAYDKKKGNCCYLTIHAQLKFRESRQRLDSRDTRGDLASYLYVHNNLKKKAKAETAVLFK